MMSSCGWWRALCCGSVDSDTRTVVVEGASSCWCRTGVFGSPPLSTCAQAGGHDFELASVVLAH